MSHTNSTENYGLPQWIGSDKPTFLGDFNDAFGKIDKAMKDNADASTAAVNTANSAASAATAAATNATSALNTANSAASDAAGAVTTAGQADTKATQALAAASGAETAAAANTIENLAPAYDATLTYNVGDLVTFVDAQGHGKLYKCIVAVGTPEAFNINKWDDVTTSEAFGRKPSILLTHTCNGSETYSDILNMIADELLPNPKYCYIDITSASGETVRYNFDSKSNTYIKWSNIDAYISGTIVTTCLIARTNNESSANRFSVDSSNTVTNTTFTSATLAAGDIITITELL